MSVLQKLASALGRRDKVPNQELARAIAASKDAGAVTELVEHLASKNKDIQSDCIKVLYEIGEQNPALIAPQIEVFAKLLDSKNNRLAWGAMTNLDAIADADPVGVYDLLPKIMSVADSGSVITRDHAVNILIKLAAHRKYSENCFTLLLEQLAKAPSNQLPMYAENALPVINAGNKTLFVKVLSERLGDIEKESKRARVEKVIRKVSKQG